ncbi:hypothetical protein QZH41_001186 [Actinostola sp. cb2023]|nr:hypothetical protein QZH41_001186 [Actinostola sp. cb2023]
MGETGQVFDYCTLEKKASDPIQFRSGHESDAYSSPLPSPRSPYGSPGPCLNTIDKREKKPSKRTRKISLFSQFHFNARSDDKHGKSRKVSAPTISSLVPCSTMTLGYTEADILPDLSSDSSTSSVQSQQSSSSLPVLLTVDNASFLSRPKSSGTCSANDKETASIRYIILETLSLQFENVTEYKREICDKLGKNVSELVRRRVEIMKEGLGQPCKVVTVVYVGAVRDNGIDVATQAILDNDKDIFTAGCYRNGHVFAHGCSDGSGT